MTKTIKNIGASVRAKLLNLSTENELDYNYLLLRYFQEAFLRRLSLSRYRNNLILKGALLLIPYKIENHRPTKDIDLLGKNLKNEKRSFTKILSDISQIEINDGVSFKIEGIQL